MTQVTTVARVQSLAQELAHAMGVAKKKKRGAPFVAQQVLNLSSIQKDAGSIPGLVQGVKNPVLP